MRSAATTALSRRLPELLTAGVVAVLGVVVTWNAFHYASVSGFDAEVDLQYAHILLTQWRIPAELANNYTPPGFFFLVGPLVELGGPLHLADTGDLAQLAVGAMTVATAVLLALLCAIVFPGRPWLRLAAVALYATSPTVLKLGAMFHPQPLATLLATAAVVLTAWMVARRRYGVWPALALGLVVGAGQLVRSVGVWVLLVVCLSLLVAALVTAGERRSALRALLVVGVVGVAVALPWYLLLKPSASKPVFGSVPAAPTRSLASSASSSGYGSRPSARTLWFYVDPGLPQALRTPYRGAMTASFWPVLYADGWGDYYGNWAWEATERPLTPSIERRLRIQAYAGIVPTLLTGVGLLALALLALGRIRSRPELLVVPLAAAAGLAATLWYAYSYPSPDADTVKAMFLLPALPALAVGFGFALETIARRRRAAGIVLGAVCAVAFAVSLAFGVA